MYQSPQDQQQYGQQPPSAPRTDSSLGGIWHFCLDIVTNHYADASGTATRREFWTFWLAKVITCVALAIVFAPAAVLLDLGLIIPTFALGARRLHETGKSGWWQALQLVPILGWIIVAIMLAQPAKVTSSGPSGPSGQTTSFTQQPYPPTSFRWES